MGLTPAPVEAWYLAWIALVPLWMAIALADRSGRRVFWAAIAWGCGYHGWALFWITGIHPMTWMGVPWLASLLTAIACWSIITLWGAALVAAWALSWGAIARRTNHPWLRILTGVALWCGWETVWSWGPLWWSSLAYTQSPHNLPLLQGLQLSGPATVTAVLVAVNGAIAEALLALKSNHRRSLALGLAALGVLASTHLAGWAALSRPLAQPEGDRLRVGIIQGNIPNEIKLYTPGGRRALQGYSRGYRQLAAEGVDLVMTPETALPFFWETQLRSSSAMYRAIVAFGTPAIVGAFGQVEGTGYANSLFAVTGDGTTRDRFDKVILVPLGEYVPLESLLGKLVDRLSPLEARLVAGEPTQTFETPVGRAIAAVCYESAFSRHFRNQAAGGGEFILSAANNAHYSPSMPAQHHAQDVMRAIETDRWAVRATNTGYSAIVDPRGHTLWRSRLDTYELHAGEIYRQRDRTLYVAWGDWLTPTLLLLAAIGNIAVLALVKYGCGHVD